MDVKIIFGMLLIQLEYIISNLQNIKVVLLNKYYKLKEFLNV